MRNALILVHGNPAAILTEYPDQGFDVAYLPEYDGVPVSLSFPVREGRRRYSEFPAFLDNLLLEGAMLEGFLRRHKVDQDDYFSQLIMLGEDLAGALTVREMHNDLNNQDQKRVNHGGHGDHGEGKPGNGNMLPRALRVPCGSKHPAQSMETEDAP